MKKLLLSLLCLLLLASCTKEQIFPRASGRPYEVLVVLDKQTWEAPAGRALFDILDTDALAIYCAKVARRDDLQTKYLDWRERYRQDRLKHIRGTFFCQGKPFHKIFFHAVVPTFQLTAFRYSSHMAA